MKIKKLLPDGSYSDSPYGNHIDGYGESDDRGRPRKNSGKALFLKHAAAVLRQVGLFLAEKGMDRRTIDVSRSGVAGSGEVYGEYWTERDSARKILVQIGTSCVEMLSGRKDGVCIIARTKQEVGETGKKRTVTGQNQWISPGYDSRELADQLWDIYSKNYQSVRVCSKAEGAMVLPNLTVKSEEEGIAAMVTYRAVTIAMNKDARTQMENAIQSEQLALIPRQ